MHKTWCFSLAASFSLAVVAFSYGFVASQFKLFPYEVLRDAKSALLALVNADASAENNGLVNYRQQVLRPTALKHKTSYRENYIVVSGGLGQQSEAEPSQIVATIIDRDGKVVHEWKCKRELWAELEKVTRVPGVSGPIGVASIELHQNGDLLANFHGFNTFPFAVGMARFDASSKLIWRKELLTHHSFTVSEDRIVVPALEVLDSPIRIGETAAMIESESGKIYHDMLLTLDADGNELQRISIKDALFKSGWTGHLIRENSPKVASEDPLHLNDVRVIDEISANKLAGINAGDLLISLRNINLVGILDPHSQRFKWISSGATVGQHSPRVYKNGVLVLDNLGGDRNLGGTRLVHIDFQSGLPRTIFPREHVEMPDLCRTANSGNLEISKDQRFALLTVSHEGAIWEIDLETGEVIWEYINVRGDGSDKRLAIGVAKYVDELPK